MNEEPDFGQCVCCWCSWESSGGSRQQCLEQVREHSHHCTGNPARKTEARNLEQAGTILELQAQVTEMWADLLWVARAAARLAAAVQEHHAQKADDRCWEDDVRLYQAAGLPVPEGLSCVGDKAAMLENCKRFIQNRCAGGVWKSYAELEAENVKLREILHQTLREIRLHNQEYHYATPHSFLEGWDAVLAEGGK